MIAVFAITTGKAQAQPFPQKQAKLARKEGVFNGTLYADNGSRPPITLNLTHRGNVVGSTVFAGKGLRLMLVFVGRAIPKRLLLFIWQNLQKS